MQHQAQPQIIVYTSGPTCIDCNTIKSWLTEHGYPFEERNVREDPAALDELKALDLYGAPVTIIGDDVIDGLDMPRMKALLGYSGG